MNKTALVTGITGQDGSYLAEFLVSQGYRVVGVMRRSSVVNLERIRHFQDKFTLVHGDLLDEASLIGLLREFEPSEVYNLAAQSFVPTSWQQPVLTGEVTALGVTRLLDAIMSEAVNDGHHFKQSIYLQCCQLVRITQRQYHTLGHRSPKIYSGLRRWLLTHQRQCTQIKPASQAGC